MERFSAVLILLLISLVHTMDRSVPTIIAEFIKADFGLTDMQLGLFTGMAYSLSYAGGTILIGPLVDRWHRVRMLSGMLFIWSGLTALGAAVTAYWQLLLVRFSVGAAEAGAGPASLSIIADVFPPHQRGRVIGIYKIGTPLGYFIASAGCGYIASEYGWRTALLVAGLPGMLLAFFTLKLLPEPVRGATEVRPVEHDMTGSTWTLMRGILALPGIAFLILGLALFSFANAGLQAFVIPFFLRVHHLDLITASSYFAVASALGGISPFLLGMLNDRLSHGSVGNALYLAALLAAITFASGTIMATASSLALCVAGFFVWQMLVLGMSTTNLAALLTLTPPAARGRVMSLLLVIIALLGLGGGPVVLGAISDRVGGATGIRYAVVITLSINILATLAYASAGHQIRRVLRPAPA